MKTISEILKPRESVFSDTVRDDVLNLSDFADGKVDADKFFSENFETQGMKMLFDTAFKRFRGQSDTGVIKLTQAMGGGKTHSMLALALLADNEYLRGKILGDSYKGIGKIKVVTFSGRENAEYLKTSNGGRAPPGKKSTRQLQDLIGPAQFLDFALQGFDAIALFAGDAFAHIR
jgi:hypothetical protein